jgi:glycosyltransferase involved in cell wall biosynthesis
VNIFQLIHTLSYGDAISGEALALQRCVTELGHTGKIYSIHTHTRLTSRAESYENFPKNFEGIVILHYSLGSPLNALFRSLDKAKRIIIFHNLTPEKYFANINPRVAKDIAEGWRELPELARLSDLVISDSSYNASELRQHQVESMVLPLPYDPARWQEQANPGLSALVRNDPGIHVLHVGRLAPNKCIEDLLKTFYFLHHHVSPKSRLWLVGIDIDTEIYSFGLKRLAKELSIDDNVNFTGPLSDSEIRALYENCSVYVGMSEHEGFCVPLLEAMHYGLPVLAYDCTAVSETVGTGGILFKEKRYPELAQIISEVSRPGDLRDRVIEKGRARVGELSYDKFKERVSETINSLSRV